MRNNFNKLFINLLKVVSTYKIKYGIINAGKKEEKQESDLEKLINRGKQLLQEGNIVQAFDQYTVALENARQLQHEDDIYHIKEQLGIITMELQQFEKAEPLLSEVAEYLRKTGHDETDLKIIYINLKLAKIYQNLKNDSKAEVIFDKCYKNLKPKVAKALSEKDEETLVIWIKILLAKAYYYLHRTQYETSYSYFKEAYDMCVRFRGEVSEEGVLILKNLGAVCFEKGDLESAIEYLNKAVDIGKHLPGMVQLSSAYVSLGNIYLRQGLLKEAELNCSQGYKNAVRHGYKEGIEEANLCLEEIKVARE